MSPPLPVRQHPCIVTCLRFYRYQTDIIYNGTLQVACGGKLQLHLPYLLWNSVSGGKCIVCIYIYEALLGSSSKAEDM